MRVTKHGHACLSVESGGSTLLLDPGSFSSGFEDLPRVDAVLITHAHPDHLDLEALTRLAAAHPSAVLVVDPGSAAKVEAAGFAEVHQMTGGDERVVAGVEVRAIGTEHAVIHPELDVIPNTGYLLGGRLLHPGDALTVPDTEVELLAIPAVAPWSKVAETVEFLRAVRPRTAFPIHDAIVAPAARGIYDGALTNLADAATTYRRIDEEPLEAG